MEGASDPLTQVVIQRLRIGQQIGEAAAYGVVTVVVTIVIATLALRKLFTVFTEEARG